MLLPARRFGVVLLFQGLAYISINSLVSIRNVTSGVLFVEFVEGDHD